MSKDLKIIKWQRMIKQKEKEIRSLEFKIASAVEESESFKDLIGEIPKRSSGKIAVTLKYAGRGTPNNNADEMQ